MAAESDVLSEIEVLQSIYVDELTVTHTDDGGWTVSILLHPSTGEDCLAQFVRLTLTMDLDPQYPSSPPRISICNPRGLSDDKLLSLKQSLQMEVESCTGMPVLYQLIEKAKEVLTESNIPHGNCVICLYGFKEGEVFTKTSCYHYFHSHCLGRYITHSEEELRERVKELEKDKTREGADEELSVVCPVCREPLTYDVNTLLSSPVPNIPQQEDDAVGAEFKRKWADLQKILERQKERGGIIDPEAESNRFLIHINEVPAEPTDAPCTDAPNSEPTAPPPLPSPESLNPAPLPRAESTSRESQRRPYGRRPHCDYKGGKGGRGRGGRRGGGPAPYRTAQPVVDGLAKLRLSSETESGPTKCSMPTQNSDDCVERRELSVELNQPVKPVVEECITSSDQESPEPEHELPVDPNVSADAVQPVKPDRQLESENRERGRRHGSHRPPYSDRHDRNAPRDNSGSAYHYRGGRGHRARGAGFSNHYRGRGKGFQQRTESDFRKEGVL
ncbi:E3 ubiquitin-protein ligase RNF25 [Trichomycterus rosablanca]|uniref:E3 ubiquitin-protein ligase RNF25 n=1 Tax=Trichomycterus rosablanca TaxID=2290929 RepID=UPI002F350A40